MKKIKDLTKLQKIMMVIYSVVLFMALCYTIVEMNDPNNYRTIITCGDKTLEYNSSLPEGKLKEVCPEAFVKNRVDFYTDINITELIEQGPK